MAHLSPEDRLPRRGPFAATRQGACLYRNPLATPDDLAGWRSEGQVGVSFPDGRLRLESLLGVEQGQAANFLLWCPQDLPDGVAISFDFHPLREPGLAMLWFAARGHEGRDLFDPALPSRDGCYDQYRFGAIDAYHASYFRRGRPGSFQVCNLRKSHGFHLVAQGGDPIPSGVYEPPYRIRVLIRAGWIQFEIDDLVVFTWHDDGSIGGSALAGGHLGFRQMAPLVAEYGDLEVHDLIG